MVEQPALALHTEAVVADVAARPDDAMARDDETDRVRRVRGSDGTRRARRADACGELAVTDGLAGPNFAQRLPHELLEDCALRRDRNRVECIGVARELIAESQEARSDRP